MCGHSCTLCGVCQKLPITDDAICDKAAASAHYKCIKVNHHIFTALGRLCTSAMVRIFMQCDIPVWLTGDQTICNRVQVNKGCSTSHILVVSSSPLFAPGLWSQINFSPTSEFCQIRFQAALVLKLTISLSGAQKQCLSWFQQLR